MQERRPVVGPPHAPGPWSARTPRGGAVFVETPHRTAITAPVRILLAHCIRQGQSPIWALTGRGLGADQA